MKSINKRFVIEHIVFDLPNNSTRQMQRQINNMVGYIVDTWYPGSQTAFLGFNDINNNVIEGQTLQGGMHRYFFQRPISMYLNDIGIAYNNLLQNGSDQIVVNIWLIGEKTIDTTPYRR